MGKWVIEPRPEQVEAVEGVLADSFAGEVDELGELLVEVARRMVSVERHNAKGRGEIAGIVGGELVEDRRAAAEALVKLLESLLK
jgi:hypothetical protein